MNNNITRILGITALMASIVGCSNTTNGAMQDASNNAKAVDKAAASTDAAVSKAAGSVKDLPKDVNSAAIITPEVKTAIIRDPVLNNPQNLVNVDSHDNVTKLSGHVLSAEMKQRAADDAQTVLTKRHPDYKLVNQLVVKP